MHIIPRVLGCLEKCRFVLFTKKEGGRSRVSSGSDLDGLGP